jgi:ACS family hexuronate transporter-like MFS transporter
LKAERKTRVRWWIAWTLFFSTVSNYISRQSFSVLSPLIAHQFHFTHAELGRILGTFQIAYALTWLLGGILLDSVGVRIGLAVAAVWWSLMNILTGTAHTVMGFAVLRFMLGVGEGLNWPGASKTVAEWFPREERSLAVAVFDSGSSVGGALAALFIPLIAIAVGWRWAFVAAGAVGLVWVVVWLKVYKPLESHPKVSAAEMRLIQSGRNPAPASTERGLRRYRTLLKNRNVWGVVLGRSLTDPIWWFYVFWLPQYLSDARGYSLKQIAFSAWVPFVAADIGNFTGGWISGYCVRRGVPVIRARIWVCVVSCIPMLAGIPVGRIHSPYLALGLIAFALWGYASWSTMGLTLPSDLFPQDVVATVTGLSGFCAGLLSAGFTFMVGLLVDRFSYAPAFVVAGMMPLLATLCVVFLIRPPTSDQVQVVLQET